VVHQLPPAEMLYADSHWGSYIVLARESVSTTKYFGDNINDELKWGSHINSSTNKTDKTLGFVLAAQDRQ